MMGPFPQNDFFERKQLLFQLLLLVIVLVFYYIIITYIEEQQRRRRIMCRNNVVCARVCEYARNNLHLGTFTITTTRKLGKRKENITMAGNSNPQAQMAGLKYSAMDTEQQARGVDMERLKVKR